MLGNSFDLVAEHLDAETIYQPQPFPPDRTPIRWDS
jgi:hypothetical protein